MNFNGFVWQYLGFAVIIIQSSFRTTELQEMIEAGVVMVHADTPGNYAEVDTQQDFELAQTNWREEA